MSFAWIDVLCVSAEASTIEGAMQCDLFHAMIEDANDLRIPSHPNIVAKVLRIYRVERTLYGHMSVASDSSLLFVVERKAIWSQSSKEWLLHFEGLRNLLLGRRHGCEYRLRFFFPMFQVLILLLKGIKRFSLRAFSCT